MPPTPGISGDVVAGSLVINNLTYDSTADALTAHAGGGQTSALALTTQYSRVSTVATAADSVKLPPTQAIKPTFPGGGIQCLVQNSSATAMQVFGAGTDTINGVATATGVSQPGNSLVAYVSFAAGAWFSLGLGTGNSGGLQTLTAANAVAAAGTTQGTGTQLTAQINNVSTVGAASGVNLPASAAGLRVAVINTGVNPLLVYPLQGATDTINGIAATIGVKVLPGTTGEFYATAAGAWNTEPATTKMAAFNTDASTGAISLTAADITGGVASVDLALTGAQGGGVNAQLPTVAATELLLHAPVIGTSYRLRIVNEGSGQIITVTTNTGWTLTGTMTIANNTWREFVVTLTSLAAATLQNVAVGTFS